MKHTLTTLALLGLMSSPAYSGGYQGAREFDGGINLLNRQPLTPAQARALEVRNQVDTRITDLQDFYAAEKLWRANPGDYDIEGRLLAAERRTGMQRRKDEPTIIAGTPGPLSPAKAEEAEETPEPGVIIGLLGLFVASTLIRALPKD